MFLILALLCCLVAFVCGVIILIAAFQESALDGILSLCIPFYILYFAFAKYKSENKNVIIGVWIGSIIASFVFNILGAVMAGGG